MKSLAIKSDCCILTKGNYKGIEINDTPLIELIEENLPEEIKDFTSYPVKLTVQIEFVGDTDLSIDTNGYSVKGNEVSEE